MLPVPWMATSQVGLPLTCHTSAYVRLNGESSGKRGEVTKNGPCQREVFGLSSPHSGSGPVRGEGCLCYGSCHTTVGLHRRDFHIFVKRLSLNGVLIGINITSALINFLFLYLAINFEIYINFLNNTTLNV